MGCTSSDSDEVEAFNFSITSMSTEEGKVGDTITIRGTNFSPIASESTVTFDDVTATITSATTTTLDVIVPQLSRGISTITLKIQGVSQTVGTFSVSIDDYKYIAVANNRAVYSIGNLSGETVLLGNIEHSESRSIKTNTISNTETKIFVITNYYLGNTLELLVYDKNSGQTTEVPLEVPSTLEGPYKSIAALVWDEQTSLLTGLLNTNEYDDETEYHIININPTTYEVIDTGITTPLSGSPLLSFVLANNKIYYSAVSIDSDVDRDLVEVDLAANTASLYYFNNYPNGIWRLSKTNDTNNLLAFRTIEGTNNVIPITIDFAQNTLVDITPNNGYTLVFLDGKSFYDPNTNQNLNVIGDYNIGYTLYKFNESSQDLVNLDLSTGDYFNLYIVGILE